MICNNCGSNNRDGAKFCKKCGTSLVIYDNRSFNKSSQVKKNESSNKVIIISISIILITLIIAGTVYFTMNNDGNINSNDNQNNQSVDTVKKVQVNTATFYLDGNPNTGITATINVGKEYTGENIEILTTYSRDGYNLNNPSTYENHKVDDEGNIVITVYDPIPKYPDYCNIKIKYNNQIYQFGCDMGKYKGSQTVVPKMIE
ncbi:MAG: zinc ribbon domain-containing protein [Methanosphaera stadtmanae]|nr:zinc ribbon domain-containing protein [Methanosphaera stadtmanae]